MSMMWRGLTARMGRRTGFRGRGRSRRWLRPVRWIWRLPEEGLPDALRLRRLSRWIAWRLAGALALGAVLAGALASSGGAAGWLAWLVPVPLLLDLALWRAVPLPLRLAVRSAELAEEILRVNGQMGSWGPLLVFDPDLGYAGLPTPEQFAPAPAALGDACQISPTPSAATEDAGGNPPGPELSGWLTFGSLKWTGRSLVLVDGRSKLVEIPLAGPDGDARSPLAARPTELVLLRERTLGQGRGYEGRVLLLDASGRRLLTMPGMGLDESRLRNLAAAAGLAFSRHSFLLPWEKPGFGLVARLFPLRRGHIRLAPSGGGQSGGQGGGQGSGSQTGGGEQLAP
ncbi:hypothetical protein ABIA32_000430 [Streptacidiphilus sp. MAP12-20]|uniref:hypothetical protein n=1 Tax=Streptacidiphilus sp. MAP12-20 TaxID=3156299 RepID=UPI0035130925